MAAFSMEVLKEINDNNYSFPVIESILGFDDPQELFDEIKSISREDIIEYLNNKDFREAYHTFLYTINDSLHESLHNVELELKLQIAIEHNIKVVKGLLKPYNKHEKQKDKLYSDLKRLLGDLQANLEHTQDTVGVSTATGYMDVAKHIIFDYRDLDLTCYYLYKYPDLLRNYYGENSFIVYTVRYFFDNIDELDDNEIEYFKRVITAMVYADGEKNDDGFDELKKDIMFKLSRNDKNRKHYKYINYILAKVDKNELEIPDYDTDITRTSLDGRVDLRNLDTITMDYFKRYNDTKVLFDDAFSYEELKDGSYYIYVHVPDVDEYISNQDELNEYIKNVSQSRYAKDDKLPMIPYDLAGKMSLVAKRDIACITFRMHINNKGVILNTDFIPSIVRVNDNLSINKAMDILRKNQEHADLIKNMYNVAVLLRRQRKLKNSKGNKPGTVVEEFNTWTNIATATFFDKNNILFPYKNYVGTDYYTKYREDINAFCETQEIDDKAKKLLQEVSNARTRPFFSTTNIGNTIYCGFPYGTVGNPLRDYMSLESGRVIKSLVIYKNAKEDDLRETIENDCIEQTELNEKIKELYNKSQGTV